VTTGSRGLDRPVTHSHMLGDEPAPSGSCVLRVVERSGKSLTWPPCARAGGRRAGARRPPDREADPPRRANEIEHRTEPPAWVVASDRGCLV
jgi:hypothetical protein